MALLTTNTATQLDESGQTLLDDVASFDAAIDTVFDTALTGLTVSLSDAIQLAGNSASFQVTVDSDADTDLDDFQFFGAGGSDLDGSVDTGLHTLDGDSIYLYRDPENPQVVFGFTSNALDPNDKSTWTIDPTFMIVMEEVDNDADDATDGINLYMALFEPMQHIDDGGTPEDEGLVLDLNSFLEIGVTENLTFSFTGAPAGSNTFMAFEDGDGVSGDETIIVTGKTLDFTVNSGKGGGETTLGTNSQNIAAGDGLYFSFVTGVPNTYTVPDLSSKEASNAENIQYSGTAFDADEVTVQFVKVSTAPTDTFAVRFTVQNMQSGAGAESNSLGDGTTFHDGLLDDAYNVNIIEMSVNGSLVWSLAGGDEDPTDGYQVTPESVADPDGLGGSHTTWVISGLLEDDVVTYKTDGDHNRVLIENAQPLDDNLQFSIANFGILNAQPVTLSVGELVEIWDDNPSQNGAGASTLVREDALSGGNNDEGGAGTVGTIDLIDSLASGVDKPVSFTFAADQATLDALEVSDPLSKDGVALEYSIESGIFYARTSGGDAVLKVELVDDPTSDNDTNGRLKATLLGTVDHALDDGNDNEFVGIDLTDLLNAEDADHDTVSLSAGFAVVQIQDDLPIVTAGSTAETVQTSDVDLGSDTSASLASAFSVLPGADGEASRDYDLVVNNTTSGLFAAPSGEAITLALVSDYIVGSTTSDGEVFRISVDSDGKVTLDQSVAIKHGAPGSGTDTTIGLGSGTVGLILTVTDGDMLSGGAADTAFDELDISGMFSFADDVPTVGLGGGAIPTLTTDDVDLADDGMDTATGNVAGLFDVTDAGNDGDKSFAYTLALTDMTPGTTGIDSGIDDVATGEDVMLTINATGTVITGAIGSGPTVFTITMTDTATGAIEFKQLRAATHPKSTDDTVIGLDASEVKIEAVATLTDNDDDVASNSVDITSAFSINDDVPSISADNGSLAPIATDDDSVPDDTASQNYASAFSTAYGQDGAPDSDGTTFELNLDSSGGNTTGLADSLTGEAILLRETTDGSGDTIIEGYIASGPVVFTISSSGSTVTMEQDRAVLHLPKASNDNSIGFSGTGVIQLVGTISDRDGDTDTAPLDITDVFAFGDDGPTVTPDGANLNPLQTSDADFATDDTEDYSGEFTIDYGNDGAASTDDLKYSLALTGTQTGLTETVSGESIFLKKVGDTIVGYTASVASVFVISVNQDTGQVTLDQKTAIDHTGLTGAASLSGDGKIELVATAKDADQDEASGKINLTGVFSFTDDTPTIAMDNLVGTGTTETQVSRWTYDAGNDGLQSVTLGSLAYRIGDGTTQTSGATITQATVPAGAINGYDVLLVGDLDQNPANGTSEEFSFTITILSDGTYTIDVDEPFGSSEDLSTADGALDAGGPDAVQTLRIPRIDEVPLEVVFFGVDQPTSGADIISEIQGVIDIDADEELTEADIELLAPSFISGEKMNVSTSGIGVSNNNLDTGESFVVNPFDDVTKAKVYIDNAVSGYKSPEVLQYRIFYEDDGDTDTPDVSDWMTAPYTLLGSGKEKYFEIDGADGRIIDAIQLWMVEGTIKVPVIEFTVSSIVSVDPLYFDLTATITDGDTSTSASQFSIAIETDEDIATSPDLMFTDFEAGGTDTQADVFNFDFNGEDTTWEVTGFDTGTDLLHIIGATFGDLTITDTGDDVSVTANVNGAAREITVFDSDLLTVDDFHFA